MNTLSLVSCPRCNITSVSESIFPAVVISPVAGTTLSFTHISQATVSTLLKPSVSVVKPAIFTTHTPHDGLVFDFVGNCVSSCHYASPSILYLGSKVIQASSTALDARSQASGRKGGVLHPTTHQRTRSCVAGHRLHVKLVLAVMLSSSDVRALFVDANQYLAILVVPTPRDRILAWDRIATRVIVDVPATALRLPLCSFLLH